MADRKAAYGTAVTGTGGLTSLASSSNWTAGYEWFVIDNATEKAIDWQVQVQWTCGTTPTTNTQGRVYLVGSYDGSTWPDVIDGTASAETWTSEGVRDSVAKLAGVMVVDSTTSNREYECFFTLATFFPTVPKKVAVFFAHNSGVNSNSTAGNHTYAAQPVYETVA